MGAYKLLKELFGNKNNVKCGKEVDVRVLNVYAKDDLKEVTGLFLEGKSVLLINIARLRRRNLDEYKKGLTELKETCNLFNGKMYGLSHEWVIITPGFVEIKKREFSENGVNPQIENKTMEEMENGMEL